MRATGEEPRGDDGPGLPPGAEETLRFVRADVEATVGDPDRTRTMVRPATEPAGGEPTRTLTRTMPDGDPGRTRELRRPRPTAEDAPPPPSGGRTPRPRRRRPPVGRILALVLAIAVALPCGTWAWVWYTARQDDRPVSDAIIVLGASQYNGRPSPIFEARLAHASELYAEGVAPTVVTVGGNQPGDNFTEAGSGRDWLIRHGVPGERIVAVDRGSDTLQSIDAVSGVFQQNGWTTAVIVTDPWHSLRSRIMAEDFGIEAATSPARSGPAVQERRTQLWYITRETASLWYYWIFGDSSSLQVDAA
ncbi:YdcF family protein [Marinactinospora thermotolerans]|uniref:Uncharacterized SAM-binding protein YcdF, DUF218 family n=1 Tax=Marinactinospora thermotolerans DSM 45154 TaxID=1122192 RepID=A0A1T4LRB4_9ACTN|nr:YdcF family protein [Marinactinospora thermotolerans]SJZ56984.1 Uncharacterized SAM-binding protein YcdF, DUF218 family [Marinactinospora thermotolerans DSM 45154]